MRRALALAARGRGAVSPNPMAGCVLVKKGRVVAEGWHKRFGGPHAEPDALKKAGRRAEGATAYVTLEPCCFYGKTPACTQALIRAGVRKVVAAMKDPNPRVAGKGLAALRRAGIRVSTGLLEDESRGLNRAYITWSARKRPYVVVKAAASLDGRIETSARESKWITSPEARKLARRMRSELDAVLVGVDTVIADDPRLTARSGGRDPVRVVLDARLRTPLNSRVVRGKGHTLIVTSRAPSRHGLPRRVEFIRVQRRSGRLDLRAALRGLAERGISSLLVEGGSKVHTSFLESGLADEIRIFYAPRLLGGAKARTFFEGAGFRRLAGAPALDRMSVRRVGPDLLVTGFISNGRK